MPQSRSNARRRRRTTGRSSGASAVWLERAWRFVARPEFVGVLTFVAGLVALIAPTSNVADPPSYGWWTAAFRFPDASRVVASLLAGSAVVALGIAAATALSQSAAPSRSRRRRRRIPREKLLEASAWSLMIVGAATGIFVWLASQAALPPSRVAVAPGQTIESFPAIASGRSVKVMLPQRLRVVEVDPTEGRAVIELVGAGDEAGVLNDIYVGDPLPLQGFTVALLGVETNRSVYSAVMSMEGGIEARASVGEKVRFVPDGPQYEVRQIVRNYVGRMGPGVQLAPPEGETFWVFERDSQLDEPMTEFRLQRLETAPVAVLAFASAPFPGGLPAGGVIFVAGLALFLLRPEQDIEAVGEEEE